MNPRLPAWLNPDEVEVVIRLSDAAEVDAMWSFVRRKKDQSGQWHAIDHHPEAVLGYVFGRRQDEVFLKLKALLEPFGITRYDKENRTWQVSIRKVLSSQCRPC